MNTKNKRPVVNYGDPWMPLRTLFFRECHRFFRIWRQSIGTPVMTTSLYLLIFGVSLGKHIQLGHDIPYLDFIVPGLVIMGIITASAANASSSFHQSKYNGSIIDLLIAPMSNTEIALAYTLAGTMRGLLVGTAVMMVGRAFTVPFPVSPALAFTSAFLTGWIFSSFGGIVGIIARRFEGVVSMTTLFLTPLTYLGGIFYSLTILPPFWAHVSTINPIFYIIDTFRYAYLGISDFHPFQSLAVTVMVAILAFGAFVYTLGHAKQLRA